MLYLALPVAALGILFFAALCLARRSDDASDDFARRLADGDDAWLAGMVEEVLREQAIPEHSHRSPLCGRRPSLGVFDAGVPADRPRSPHDA